MHQRGIFGNFHIGPDFFSDDAGNMCHFGTMFQHVLAVTGTEFKFAQQFEHFFGNANYADFTGSVFTRPNHGFLDFFLGFFNYFFNTPRVYTAVFEQHFQRLPRNFSPHRIKTAEHYIARRVINHNVHAGGTLQGLDVAAFFANYPTFHFFVFQLD